MSAPYPARSLPMDFTGPKATLADFRRRYLHVACHRCPYRRKHDTRRLDWLYGRDTKLSELLLALTVCCGRRPSAESGVAAKSAKPISISRRSRDGAKEKANDQSARS